MSKLTLVACALFAFTLSGCFSGEAYGIATDENAITMDGGPVPGNNDYPDHFGKYWEAQGDHLAHAFKTFALWSLNTNYEYPPYETFFEDQEPRAMWTIGKTFDVHLFNYDWDDPFLN